MAAPRIDTVRKNLHDTLALIALALEQLDDLHTLAYERHTATERIKTSGGTRDYALDTHGDPRARKAYEHLATAALDISEHTSNAIHQALQILATGETHTRRDTTADATSIEVLEALAAQLQTKARGDYVPHATQPQPLPPRASKLTDAVALRKDLDNLQTAVRKIGGRPDRARLTPLELTAWQTAQGINPKRRKKR